MGRRLQTTITLAMWAIVASAAVGASLMFAYRSLMLIATVGMLCDSCNSFDDLLIALGLWPFAVILLIGAIVLIVWHRDRWPYKMAAPAMLAVAIAAAPSQMRWHWFWWLGF
jgi:nitrate reductase NapE component